MQHTSTKNKHFSYYKKLVIQDRSGGESIDFILARKIQQLTLGISYDFAIYEIGKEPSGAFETKGRFTLPERVAEKPKN